MKALIYKDLITLWKYCRTYLILCAVFLMSSVFAPDYEFLQLYSLVVIGALVNTTIAYDERDRWEKLVLTMPITRRQIVTSKYLLGLILQGTVAALTAAANWMQMTRAGAFSWDAFLSNLGIIAVLALTTPSLMLPFVFKNGSEKGRMAYMIAMGVMMGLAFGGSVLLEQLEWLDEQMVLNLPGLLVVLMLLLYAGSWALSVRWYEKREF